MVGMGQSPLIPKVSRSSSRHGSFMEAAELFDHNFFGISAKQARELEGWGGAAVF